MRLPILWLFPIAAALGEIQATSAQSPTSYPWCSKSPEGGSTNDRPGRIENVATISHLEATDGAERFAGIC
jgi:hypothetical protein